MSSAVERLEIGAEGVVRLAGDVALEAAEDLASVEPVSGPFAGVGAGAVAVAEPADGDHVQGPVRLAIATVVEAVAGRAAGAGRDRGGAADPCEGGLAAQALDVLAGGDEELAGALGADREELDRARGGEGDESLELLVELGDLALELARTSCEAAQRELRSLRWLVQPVT